MNKGPPDEAPAAPGDVIAGKYRVERVLGRGGMGVVVAARRLSFDDLVAIKFLLPTSSSRPEALARFAREARATARVKNEFVARVIDDGTLDSGVPFIVMEYLEGHDLAHELRTGGVMPIARACELVLQACVALAEAHAVGVVHRDVKPANLFLARGPDETVGLRVLDFGISKVAAEPGALEASITQTASVVGSPLYMSPEQVSSAKLADAGSDVWALGVVLYEMLTGRTPFEGPTLAHVAARILRDEPEPPRRLRPELPAALDAAIVRCLVKDRTRRTRDMAELSASIAPFARPEARRLTERTARAVARTSSLTPLATADTVDAAAGVDRTGVGSSATHNWAHSTASALRSSRGWALAALVAAGTVGGFALIRSGRPTRPATGAASANAARVRAGDEPTSPARSAPPDAGPAVANDRGGTHPTEATSEPRAKPTTEPTITVRTAASQARVAPTNRAPDASASASRPTPPAAPTTVGAAGHGAFDNVDIR